MKTCTRLLVSLGAIGLLAMAVDASAQDEAPPEFEHIKTLEPFIGFWEYESPEEIDSPMMLSSRFIGNGRYLQMQVSSQSEEGRHVVGTLLIGWDHGKNQVTYWGFWPDQQPVGKVEVGNGSAKWTETASLADGVQASANVVMKVSGDELIVDVTEGKRGDESQPEMRLKFKRSERRGRRP